MIGETARDFDRILVVVLQNHLPDLLGSVGTFLASLVLVAIMAAAMSTADSNLHAMSALLTHDVYDQYIRPQASQRERTWVGRIVIALATGVALVLVIMSRNSPSNPLGMIVILGLLAIAFATQLLPMTCDMLFFKKGTRLGAICGALTGLVIVFTLSPFWPLVAGEALGDLLGAMKRTFDIGAWGVAGNTLIFTLVSLWERRT